MQTIQGSSPCTINYAAADQASSLFARASVYDVSTGTAVFVSTVNLTELIGGVYSGVFTPAAAKTYLVIIVIFTDGTYTTIDTGYGPSADCYKTLDAPSDYFAFNYGTYDQNPLLSIAGNIYDGALAFIAQVPMLHVFAGVYLGTYSGLALETYDVVKLVYTDGTYAVIDTSRSPGSDTIQLFSGVVGSGILFGPTELIGGPFSATLIEEC